MTAELRPEVVILDLMLPDLTGYEVCRRLRADPMLGEAGILVLTARGEEIDLRSYEVWLGGELLALRPAIAPRDELGTRVPASGFDSPGRAPVEARCEAAVMQR